MSEEHYGFTDVTRLEPDEFTALVGVHPLPALDIQCAISHPMWAGEDSWRIREDGRLTYRKCVRLSGGGCERLPAQPSACDPARIRALLDEVIWEQLWLYAEDDDAWEATSGVFDAPDELRIYVCFEDCRFIAGRATGLGFEPVMRLARCIWKLFPWHQPTQDALRFIG